MIKRADVTPCLLRELISYNPETGSLSWKERAANHFRDTGNRSKEHIAANWNSRYEGTPALNADSGNGYLTGSIFNLKFYAHRVAYCIYHGEWASADIDHINGNGKDNRIENLRSVSRRDNCRNRPMQRNNNSGLNGVHWNKACRKWRVTCLGEDLGLYENIDDAAIARASAERGKGFHDNHGRVSQISDVIDSIILEYMKKEPSKFRALVQQLADRDARGTRAPVPGVAFIEVKEAR